MSLVDVVVPNLGESIAEGTVTTWLVRVGEAVVEDQPLLELETDKVTAELPSPVAGILREQVVAGGEDVAVGAVVARVEAGAEASEAAPVAPSEAPPAEAARPEPATQVGHHETLSPAVERLVHEHDLDPAQIAGSGRDGRLLKGDVLAHLEAHTRAPEPAADPRATLAVTPVAPPPPAPISPPPATRATDGGGRQSRRVKMTRLRRAVARRLKEVQDTAALLTTFNEVDMQPVMDLRSRYKDAFHAKHGVKLGFMSFFTKAAVEGLKRFPKINGRIDGDDIVYNDFYDVGVAVSTPRGLVVPVLRDVDRLSFAEIEKEIARLGVAGRDGTLTLDQLAGGTFTITNGGIFGSMLSTPIVNGDQSAILGMHNIVRRPVAVGDEVLIRPVMYVALSYDHRIVDGAEAVRFLVTIKEILEDPARLLLEV